MKMRVLALALLMQPSFALSQTGVFEELPTVNEIDFSDWQLQLNVINHYVYVCDASKLIVMDPRDNHRVLRTLTLPMFDVEPPVLINGLLYVRGSGKYVAVIDPARNHDVIKLIPVGERTNSIVEVGKFVSVTDEKTVTFIDPTTLQVVKTMEVGRTLKHAVAVNGKLFVTGSGLNGLSIISTELSDTNQLEYAKFHLERLHLDGGSSDEIIFVPPFLYVMVNHTKIVKIDPYSHLIKDSFYVGQAASLDFVGENVFTALIRPILVPGRPDLPTDWNRKHQAAINIRTGKIKVFSDRSYRGGVLELGQNICFSSVSDLTCHDPSRDFEIVKTFPFPHSSATTATGDYLFGFVEEPDYSSYLSIYDVNFNYVKSWRIKSKGYLSGQVVGRFFYHETSGRLRISELF